MALKTIIRFLVVARHFLPLILTYARDRHRFLLFGRSRNVSPDMRRRRAKRLLDSLLTLGPTFIKLGQLLSTRPDILPPEYIEVLSQLQDRVPPAEWEQAKAVIEAELGPVEEVFDTFETEPISGASLGQVYRATLDGEDVAVKVRRPGIEALVAADLRVIKWQLPIIELFVDEARAFSLSNLASEFERTIQEEMDYEREAAMLEEIRENFQNVEAIAIPDVIDSHSGETVLTMEYISGTKISDIETLDAKGIDRSEIARRLDRAYLKMIILDGVFHADPHPGNLAVQDDGTIVFYDFGMSGRVEPQTRDSIVDFYVAVANQDIDAILDTLIEMGTLSPSADRGTMAEVMELAIRDARGEEIETWRVNQIISRVEDTIYEFPLRLPSHLALVLRVATVVEGVCVTLDPEFDFIAVATTFLTEHGYRERGARRYMEQYRDQVIESTGAVVRTPPKLESMLDRFLRDDGYFRADLEDSNALLETLARRIIYGLVFSASLFSTSALYAFDHVDAAMVLGGFTILVGLLLVYSFRGRRGIKTYPQFTRQSLQQKRRRR